MTALDTRTGAQTGAHTGSRTGSRTDSRTGAHTGSRTGAPVDTRPAVHTSSLPVAVLLGLSRRGLLEAGAPQQHPTERYAQAHLAALRAAAAVLACRARPAPGRRSRPTSAWVLLTRVAPELGEWATFFASGARKRAAAEAGLPAVTAREADDLLRDAEAFLGVVETALGLTHQPVLSPG